MLSFRGLVVLAAALLFWLAARLVGSPELHVVAVGVAVLPAAAALYVRWNRQRLSVRRRLSATRLWPGQRMKVELEVENRSSAATSFLLVEDDVPAGLGRPARMVLTGVPGRNSQRVSYSVACRARGRYVIGPARIDIADPFALTKARLEFGEQDEVVVFPEIEDLSTTVTAPHGSGAGQSTSRHLFRTGEEFYTMREYQLGDDLRRIHWPSVARRGRLMIRQDESARRSVATVFLDTRVSGLGQTRGRAFEKAVSVAASLGVHLSRTGFGLRLSVGGTRPASVSEERLLETLAQVVHSPPRPLATALLTLRTSAVAETTLVVVMAPPTASEVGAMTRMGAVFGPKIAALVYPVDPDDLPPDARHRLEDRATTAMLSLARAGWEVVVLPPEARLQDVWQNTRKKLPARTASSR